MERSCLSIQATTTLPIISLMASVLNLLEEMLAPLGSSPSVSIASERKTTKYFDKFQEKLSLYQCIWKLFLLIKSNETGNVKNVKLNEHFFFQ